MARSASVLLFLILWLVASNHELLAMPDAGHGGQQASHCDGFAHCDCDCDDGCLLSCETLSLALRENHELPLAPDCASLSSILSSLLAVTPPEQAPCPKPAPDNDRRLIREKTWQFVLRAARNPGAPS